MGKVSERIGLETRRNLFHLLAGLGIVALFYYNVIDVWIILAGVLVGSMISLLSRRRRVPFIHWLLLRFEREEDRETFPGRGAFFMGIGFLIAAAIFEKDIALASVTILIVGDSVPCLVGARFGKVRHPLSDRKFLEGSAAGFFLAFLFASLFVPPVEALLASLVSMAIEGIDFVKGKKIEDNIAIPLAAGVTLTLLRAALPG